MGWFGFGRAKSQVTPDDIMGVASPANEDAVDPEPETPTAPAPGAEDLRADSRKSHESDENRGHKDDWTGEWSGETANSSHLMMHPQCFLRRQWDMLTMSMVLYVCILIPFRLAFNTADMEALNVLDLVVDVGFWTDVVANFNTGYSLEDNTTVMDRYPVALRYMQKWCAMGDWPNRSECRFLELFVGSQGRFWIDAISTIPFDQINMNVGEEYAKPLRMTKLLKLLRVLRLVRILDRLEWWSRIRFSVRSILTFFFLLLVMAHWNACVLFFIAGLEGFSDEVWVAGLQDLSGEDINENSEAYRQYIVSLYWAITIMTTVGFGDIVPTTNYERIYMIIAMLGGCSMFAYGITQVVTLLSNLNASEVRFQNEMDELSEYMNARQLPEELQHRLREFYEFKKTHGGEFLREGEILRNLPASLRNAVLMFMNKSVADKLRTVPLFEGLDEDIISRVLAKLRFKSFPPGEVVLVEGEIGNSMYFINRGMFKVDIDGNTVAKIGAPKVAFFGEVALYSKFGRRIATVTTLTYAECFALDRDDLEEIMAPVPKVMETIKERSAALYKLFEDSPGYTAFLRRMNLTDEATPVDDDKEIEFAANNEVSKMALQRLRDLDRRFQRFVKRLDPLINELADAYNIEDQDDISTATDT